MNKLRKTLTASSSPKDLIPLPPSQSGTPTSKPGTPIDTFAPANLASASAYTPTRVALPPTLPAPNTGNTGASKLPLSRILGQSLAPREEERPFHDLMPPQNEVSSPQKLEQWLTTVDADFIGQVANRWLVLEAARSDALATVGAALQALQNGAQGAYPAIADAAMGYVETIDNLCAMYLQADPAERARNDALNRYDLARNLLKAGSSLPDLPQDSPLHLAIIGMAHALQPLGGSSEATQVLEDALLDYRRWGFLYTSGRHPIRAVMRTPAFSTEIARRKLQALETSLADLPTQANGEMLPTAAHVETLWAIQQDFDALRRQQPNAQSAVFEPFSQALKARPESAILQDADVRAALTLKWRIDDWYTDLAQGRPFNGLEWNGLLQQLQALGSKAPAKTPTHTSKIAAQFLEEAIKQASEIKIALAEAETERVDTPAPATPPKPKKKTKISRFSTAVRRTVKKQ